MIKTQVTRARGRQFSAFHFRKQYLILLLSRIVAGLATEGAVAQAYIANITTKEDRSIGIGKVGAAIGVGFILGARAH